MKTLVCAVLIGLLCLSPSSAKQSPPKVQVYSRQPGELGKENTLICHVTGFYPPEISIQLMKNGVAMPGAQQTDLAFEENWHYHLTTTVAFTPQPGDAFACRVTHLRRSNICTWEPDM